MNIYIIPIVVVNGLKNKIMEKEDIKNEIENFIIYHCGSNDEQLTYLLTCLDAYIDNDHIINDEEFNK